MIGLKNMDKTRLFMVCFVFVLPIVLAGCDYGETVAFGKERKSMKKERDKFDEKIKARSLTLEDSHDFLELVREAEHKQRNYRVKDGELIFHEYAALKQASIRGDDRAALDLLSDHIVMDKSLRSKLMLQIKNLVGGEVDQGSLYLRLGEGALKGEGLPQSDADALKYYTIAFAQNKYPWAKWKIIELYDEHGCFNNAFSWEGITEKMSSNKYLNKINLDKRFILKEKSITLENLTDISSYPVDASCPLDIEAFGDAGIKKMKELK